MKRIIVICEGQTEKEFVKKTLQDYLKGKSLYLEPVLPKKTKGGIAPWKDIKEQIEKHLKQEKETFVTTLLDYYGIYQFHQFPFWQQAHQIQNKNQRLDLLEKEMKNDIDINLRDRFIPFLLLHEFEALVFSDKNCILNQLPPNDINIPELDRVFDNFSNPEDINSGKQTSPSHRLLKIIKGYDKVIYGNIIIEKIGIDRIRNKALRFNNWLNILEKI